LWFTTTTVAGRTRSPTRGDRLGRRRRGGLRGDLLVEAHVPSGGVVQGEAVAHPLADRRAVELARLGDQVRELARVVRPGGTLAMLEFGLPAGGWRPPWELYVRVGLPAAGAIVSPSWGGVGRFLGPSIRDFWRKWPEPRLLEAWREAGLAGVEARRLSVGGGIAIWGKRA